MTIRVIASNRSVEIGKFGWINQASQSIRAQVEYVPGLVAPVVIGC
jgi:hypothetical protein